MYQAYKKRTYSVRFPSVEDKVTQNRAGHRKTTNTGKVPGLFQRDDDAF